MLAGGPGSPVAHFTAVWGGGKIGDCGKKIVIFTQEKRVSESMVHFKHIVFWTLLITSSGTEPRAWTHSLFFTIAQADPPVGFQVDQPP